MMNIFNKYTVIGTIALLCLIFAIASVKGVNFPPPQNWLVAWTGWVAGVAATIVAVHSLWVGGNAAARYLENNRKIKDQKE